MAVPSESCVGVVTGGNRGLGVKTVELLAKVPGVTVVLACRNGAEASKVAARIQAEVPQAQIVPHDLDITKDESVEKFADWIAKKFPTGLDFVVNNAGFAYPGPQEDFFMELDDTLRINLFGTLRISKALAPLLRPSARLVNVSSSTGLVALAGLSDELRERVFGATCEADVTSMFNDFLADARAGEHNARGWPSASYGMSKLGVMAWTRALAESQALGEATACCVCPGWCITDMTEARTPADMNHMVRTAEMGAMDIVYLALPASFGGDSRALNGKFVRPRQPMIGNGPTMWDEYAVFSDANGGQPMPPPMVPVTQEGGRVSAL